MSYLGIDIGTFESKGVLVDEGGAILATARRPHRMQVPRPGWAEHDAEADWWGDLVAICGELLAQVPAGSVRALACSAIGPCMLPVDEAGTPLTNAVLYGVDGRATTEIEELTATIGVERLLARTGNALTSQSVGPKILWLRRNRPEVWVRTARLHTSTSFLVERLTGEAVIDHYSAAGFGPLYDVERREWSAELADIMSLRMLPRLGWSAEIAGRISDRAAAAIGLSAGTPVAFGTIDAAAEALSVGVREAGDTMLMYGSTVFIIALTDAPVCDARLWYAPWLFPGLHASMAGLATSGTLTHWFRDELARDLQDAAFERLGAEAAAVPAGADGLIVLPYFSGERTPIHDPSAKGVLFGLNLTHTRGHLYRAVLEGIACGTAHALEACAEAGAVPRRLLAVGGGVQNNVWAQATSDFCELDQVVCTTSIGASYGDAFLAAVAIGDAAPDDIAAWNPDGHRIVAQPTAPRRQQLKLFKRLYAQTQDLMAALPVPEDA